LRDSARSSPAAHLIGNVPLNNQGRTGPKKSSAKASHRSAIPGPRRASTDTRIGDSTDVLHVRGRQSRPTEADGGSHRLEMRGEHCLRGPLDDGLAEARRTDLAICAAIGARRGVLSGSTIASRDSSSATGRDCQQPCHRRPRQAPEVPRRRCAEIRHPGAHLTGHVRQARARPLTSSDGRMGRRSLRLASWERWTKPEGELIESSERRTRLAVPKRPHGRGVVAAKAAFAPRQVTGPSAARFGLPTNGAVWRSSPRPPASSSGTGRPPFPSPSPR